MSFPLSYPHQPPKLKFETPIFHPNVYENGEVCISILHPPEEDQYGYESAAERWSPVQTPETILLSVISMLSQGLVALWTLKAGGVKLGGQKGEKVKMSGPPSPAPKTSRTANASQKEL